jgi:hypothetical protein
LSDKDSYGNRKKKEWLFDILKTPKVISIFWNISPLSVIFRCEVFYKTFVGSKWQACKLCLTYRKTQKCKFRQFRVTSVYWKKKHWCLLNRSNHL